MKRKKLVFDYNSIPERINYESIDITKSCVDYLLENGIYINTLSTNLAYLETSIIDYSILNLAKWKKLELDSIELEDYKSIDNVCEKLNSVIPKDKKRSYFIQYAHCITYLLGVMLRQDKQISLKEVETKIPVTLIEDEDYVDQIIISDNLEPYKLPGEMFKTIKERFILEKVPRK